MGNLQQSLVCYEKRLVITHELDDSVLKGSAYGELGCLHSLLGECVGCYILYSIYSVLYSILCHMCIYSMQYNIKYL